MRFIIKILITALIVSTVSELGKRYSLIAAILASLPLTSFLALCWLYWDTKDVTKIVNLSYGILWAIIPSVVFFVCLPFFLKKGHTFIGAMSFSSVCMFGTYGLYAGVLRYFKIIEL
jgi:hypothetical protein